MRKAGTKRRRPVPRGAPAALAPHALVLCALLAACGPAYRGEPLYGPLVTADRQVVLGERVFDRHCQQCHPGGASGLGPLINDKPLAGWLIELQVRVGFGAMPSFDQEQIDDAELDAVVAYLMALRTQERTAKSARDGWRTSGR